MGTTTLKFDTECQLTEKQKSDIRAMIASYDHTIVLFDCKYTEEVQIDWDQYMDQFCCFGG